MQFHIRPEQSSDIRVIEQVTASAFEGKSYAGGYEHEIATELRKQGQLTLSLVAETDGAIIGHIAVSPVTLSDASTGWFGIGPVAVAPAAQRQGVGSALVRVALDNLRKLGANGCVLLGDPNYYQRFGFEPAAPLIYPPAPAKFFQSIVFVEPAPTANVSYSDAFR